MEKYWRLILCIAVTYLYPIAGIILLAIFAKKGYFKDLFKKTDNRKDG